MEPTIPVPAPAPTPRASPKTRWHELDGVRNGVLTRARAAAALTIPALMPEVGQDENSELTQPYQSLGARGLNNLASKLLLALFPTTASFFRLTVDEDVLDKMADKDAVEDALRRRENKTMRFMERGNLRTTLFGALKSLIAVGNTLVYLPEKAPSRTFRLDQYVVMRDPEGRVLETYIKELADPRSLKPEVRSACDVKINDESVKTGSTTKNVEIYTAVVRRSDGSGMIDYWQEINEKEVPGSRGQCKETESPYLVLRWSAMDGEHYGRGHVEEYIGDLRSLEGLAMAIVSFSAVAAKVIFLVHPNSSTSVDDLMIASTGDFVTGALKDIEALQLDKYADFKVAQAVLQDLVIRLSHAFLLQSGTVRDAERVTAEEIRQQAQELEDVLGGVYTVQSQELQLPLVRRLMSVMEREGELDKIPATAGVQPTIVTGFDALGRGHELNRIKDFFADIQETFGEQVLVTYIKVGGALKKFAIAHNVDMEDLVKTDDEVKAEQQQQMLQQTLADSATNAAGPAAGQAVKGYADSVNKQ